VDDKHGAGKTDAGLARGRVSIGVIVKMRNTLHSKEMRFPMFCPMST
jgi:hypothetical protein